MKFHHPASGKTIQVKSGDMLSLAYRGYLGQTEFYKNTITLVNDSTLLLGLPLAKDRYIGSNKLSSLTCKEIRYSDIIAFRRMSVGRILLKSALTAGVFVGSIFLLKDLYKNTDYSDLQKMGISIGIGLGVNIAVQMLLPESPKYTMADGWEIVH